MVARFLPNSAGAPLGSIHSRLGTNLVHVSLGCSGGSVLEDESRFRRFEVPNLQVRSNIKWKICPFLDILCNKNLWFGTRFGGLKFSFRG